MQKTTTFVRDLWTLLRPYWQSEERNRAWLLLLANIGLILVTVYLTVLFNQWYNAFYNTLQTKAQAEFFHQLGRFCMLAVIYIVIAVYRFYLTQLLEMRWRSWMTRHYLDRWLSSQRFYQMELARYAKGENAPPDNPDQRLAGRQRTHDFLAKRLVLHAGDEVAHHGQRDVGFQQCHAHFTQHVLDVAFGDAGLAAHLLDQPRQAIGKGRGHEVDAVDRGGERRARTAGRESTLCG